MIYFWLISLKKIIKIKKELTLLNIEWVFTRRLQTFLHTHLTQTHSILFTRLLTNLFTLIFNIVFTSFYSSILRWNTLLWSGCDNTWWLNIRWGLFKLRIFGFIYNTSNLITVDLFKEWIKYFYICYL